MHPHHVAVLQAGGRRDGSGDDGQQGGVGVEVQRRFRPLAGVEHEADADLAPLRHRLAVDRDAGGEPDAGVHVDRLVHVAFAVDVDEVGVVPVALLLGAGPAAALEDLEQALTHEAGAGDLHRLEVDQVDVRRDRDGGVRGRSGDPPHDRSRRRGR